MRGTKLYAKVKSVTGKHERHATGIDNTPKGRKEVEEWIAKTERAIEAERATGVAAMTVRRWVDDWSDDQRDRGIVDWKRNKGWLVTLVVPEIGDMLVGDVRTPHVVAMFKKIRKATSEATGKQRAGRTMHNIHGVWALMMDDAELAGHTERAPARLDERHLGKKADADPEWRKLALYERDEVQTMISLHKIPWDRRVQYAIEFLAGTRPSEAAALRWHRYDPTRQPLGSLVICRSYNADLDREKGTKTGPIRVVPVHPTLAAILAEWKLTGWEQMMGRPPTPDDLILPLSPADADARTQKTGEPFRPDYYMRKRWVEVDLAELGWRHRRHYDTRATFVTLAVEDGANRDIIRDRVTHTKPQRDGIDFYDRGDHWIETCGEVAKLKIVRLGDPCDNVIALPIAAAGDGTSRNHKKETKRLGPSLVQKTKSTVTSVSSKLRRRVSKLVRRDENIMNIVALQSFPQLQPSSDPRRPSEISS
ncbi:MAG TPA: hypothetical protein VMJ10_10395 [Kofleriaceae bacterium]|nr:hypothetical protein [Kofleriaceae bacterium]